MTATSERTGYPQAGYYQNPETGMRVGFDAGCVYVVGPIEGCYKIGFSETFSQRLEAIVRTLPIRPPYAHLIKCWRCDYIEAYFHIAFSHLHTQGEWFRLTNDCLKTIEKHKEIYFSTDIDEEIISLWNQNINRCKSLNSTMWKIRVAISQKYINCK